ncbi:MAG: asparagine synthase C-terminal domain-containing protein [Candidatus Micrarchaeota archaeon]
MADVKKLSELLVEAVGKNLGGKIAVAFSGGLDSSTIATIAKQKCSPALITVGVEGSEDLLAARKVAGEMGLELHEVVVDKKMLLFDYEEMWKLMPGTLVDVELMCAVYEVCKRAKELGCTAVLFGSGAEELFVGYHKYYSALEEGKDLDEILRREIETLPQRDIKRSCAVAKFCGVEARVPFMEKELVEAVFSIPAKERMGKIEMKKPLLREMAKELCVPSLAVERQKKAMQYGSNIHRIFLGMVKRNEIEAREPRAPFDYGK